MPVIRLGLDAASIDEAIRKLNNYKDKVEKLGETVPKRLAQDGAQQAKDLASYMGAYDSGELVDGIISEYADGKGYVKTTAPHSAYVEFGTGVVGSGSQHPMSGEYWQYDVNEHGEAGWFYIGRDGRRHWTKGMPSRPFMYDTAQLMHDSVAAVVEDELKND